MGKLHGQAYRYDQKCKNWAKSNIKNMSGLGPTGNWEVYIYGTTFYIPNMIISEEFNCVSNKL